MNPLWTLALGALCVVLLSFLCGLAIGVGLRLGGRPLPRPAAIAPTPPRRHRPRRAEPTLPPGGPAWQLVSAARSAKPDDTPTQYLYSDYRAGWYPRGEEARR